MKKTFIIFAFLLLTVLHLDGWAQAFTPVPGKFYTLTQQASGFVLGRTPGTFPVDDNGNRGTLRTAAATEVNEQSYKFVATNVPGEYYLINGLGEYLYNNAWRLRHHSSILNPEFDPPVAGTTNGYRFTVTPSATAGLFNIGTVSFGATSPRYFGSDNTTLGAFVNADETITENGTRAEWTIAASTLTASREDLAVKVSTYPNPFSKAVTVEVPGKFSYVIFDLSGKALGHGTGVNQVQLADRLTQGLYLVQVQQGASVRTVRVVKL